MSPLFKQISRLYVKCEIQSFAITWQTTWLHPGLLWWKRTSFLSSIWWLHSWSALPLPSDNSFLYPSWSPARWFCRAALATHLVSGPSLDSDLASDWQSTCQSRTCTKHTNVYRSIISTFLNYLIPILMVGSSVKMCIIDSFCPGCA